MTWDAWRVEHAGDGQGVTIADPAGDVALEVRVALPGEPPPGYEPEEDDRAYHRTPQLDLRIRRFQDVTDWSVFITVDNRTVQPVPLPEFMLTALVGDRYAGWAWSTDAMGGLLCAPAAAEGPCVMVRLVEGYLRLCGDEPVFDEDAGPPTLFDAGDADQPGRRGACRFALTPPSPLGPGRRHQVHLRFELIPSLLEVDARAPSWLPQLVAADGTEIAVLTPDQAVVPGEGVTARTQDTDTLLIAAPGHHHVAIHGPRQVHRLRLSWYPDLADLVPDVVERVMALRARARSSAAGVLVAEAVARGYVHDSVRALDWLEQEDWLTRADLMGVATAATLAKQTDDTALLSDAWLALRDLPAGQGFGLVTMRLWLASLGLTGDGPDLAAELLRRRPTDELARLELALLSYRSAEALDAPLAGAINRLGHVLPGRPLGLTAGEGARLIAVLRLCPEGWARGPAAFETAEKAQGLLLADYAAGLHETLDGLAWLMVGELGR